MVSLRTRLLPLVLPVCLGACHTDPGPAADERIQGRALLFVRPASTPAAPPDRPLLHPCPENGTIGDPDRPRKRQAVVDLAHVRP